ncbi:VOC family protein [Christensenellaceae bacterium OttesenSCG-928-M15]|nr:VOC family protein [Christensenellaceae bacterium OttesenSCG-928-M15]
MHIDHVAVYVHDLEKMRAFYEVYFGAAANRKYHNPRTGLMTYFLSFEGGSRLELMTRPGIHAAQNGEFPAGYIHISFQLEGKEAVDCLTARLKEDGYTVESGPRTTGDGYYESCVLDPEGNRIELLG